MASKNPTRFDAIAVLDEEHARLRALIRDFYGKPGRKEQIIEAACAALSAYSQLEEALFYPAAEAAIADRQLIEEARVEHDSIKQLVSKLQSGLLDDAARDASFSVMAQMVERHIEREERVLFDKIRASSMDLAALGERMRAERKKLQENPVLTQGQHTQTRGSHEHA